MDNEQTRDSNQVDSDTNLAEIFYVNDGFDDRDDSIDSHSIRF